MSVRSAVPMLVARLNMERAQCGLPFLRQVDIADAAGISQSVISALLAGRSTRIDFNTIDKLCAYFQCTPGDLFILDKTSSTQQEQVSPS
jgi:putative transcriptional regulator